MLLAISSTFDTMARISSGDRPAHLLSQQSVCPGSTA
jgi:hypothetical protein